MGITILHALSLVDGWRQGARFDSTLTLGRMDCMMSLPDLRRIARLLPREGEFVKSLEVEGAEPPRRMDGFFRALGAMSVEALDASDFDGASIIQDLNQPLAAHLCSRFDTVVDGGTLEHVFNVPMAFKNAMDALKVGGHFFAMLPANNYCGHGFYQFSAELFFRVFSAENGFAMGKLLVAPAYVAGKWLDGPAFEVSDPKQVRDRVEIFGKRKMVFVVQAQKVAQESVFATWPQQSDYAAAWARRAAATEHPNTRLENQTLTRAFRMVMNRLGGVGRVIERYRERRAWNRQCNANPALTPHRWIE